MNSRAENHEEQQQQEEREEMVVRPGKHSRGLVLRQPQQDVKEIFHMDGTGANGGSSPAETGRRLHLLPSSSSTTAVGTWKAAFFIIGNEMSERLCYYGIASNLITYMITVLHESLSTAAKNANNWAGVTLVVPLVGAFIADAYAGKYWTIVVVSIVYILGLTSLTVSVSLKSLRPPPCSREGVCEGASGGQHAFFFFSLYLISIGTGGIKPCLEAFGADQFDDDDPKEKKWKASFFNWWYFGLCMGGLAAVTLLVYVQDNVSWGLGFGIPAIAMSISFCIFLLGSRLYRHRPPDGSPITRFLQVFVAAARNHRLPLPPSGASHLLFHGDDYNKASSRRPHRQLVHTDRLRFLDKAAILPPAGIGTGANATSSPWRFCSVTQVEEVKLLLRILPIWFTMLLYGVVIAQTSTLFTKQGSTMDRRLGSSGFEIPPASLQGITAIIIIILVPIYDFLFVPAARRWTGHQSGITMLQRIGVGLFFSVLTMAAAALAEMERMKAAKRNGLLDRPRVTVPISIFWLMPQYVLAGISDVFALIGQQEFFYDQVPDTTRSFGVALYLSAMGVGSFLSSLLITIIERITGDGSRSWFVSNINRGKLEYFFWLLAALSAVNMAGYLLVAHRYMYKQVGEEVREAGDDGIVGAGTGAGNDSGAV